MLYQKILQFLSLFQTEMIISKIKGKRSRPDAIFADVEHCLRATIWMKKQYSQGLTYWKLEDEGLLSTMQYQQQPLHRHFLGPDTQMEWESVSIYLLFLLGFYTNILLVQYVSFP